jgi:tetratricopeptide (TPR) repeat protein
LDRLDYYHQLSLNELSPEGVSALVTNRLGGEPSKLALSLIQAQAQGNPFFSEELVDSLREGGNLTVGDNNVWTLSESILDALRKGRCLVKTPDGEWILDPNASLSAVDLGVPDSIHGLVLSRLDRLVEENKLTLKMASVIGRVFLFNLLAAAYPLRRKRGRLLSQVQMLEGRDFIHVDAPPPHLTHIFKHNITQEVVYGTMLEDQQRALHGAVAEALEQLDPDAVEQLAYHYSRGGVRHKTLFYLDKAARKAQADYANETALHYYNQALALEERWQWRKGQVEVLHILGRREEEKAALEALAVIQNAPPFETAYLWGLYYEAIGEYPQAQIEIERAMTVSQGEVISETRCLAQLGLIARRQGDYNLAKAWYNRALLIFKDRDTGSTEEAGVLTEVLNGLGIVHRQQSQFDEARECYEQALELSRNIGDRRGEAEALNGLGVTAYYQRNFTASLSHHRQALEIRRAIGDRSSEGISLFNLALALRETGDYGQTQEYLLAALTIHQATGNRWEEVNIWNDMGILYQELGDLSKAQNALEQGLTLSKEIGDEAGQAYILANLGPVTRDQGDLEMAEKLLTDGLTLAQKQNDQYMISYFLSHLAMVNLRTGKLDQAVEQAQSALAIRRKTNLHLWTTADLTTLAAAHLASDNPAQALKYTQQALTILDECGGEGPDNPQQDYLICYQVLSELGEYNTARAALESAYKLIIVRAEKITDPALRQSFLKKVQVNRQIAQEAERAGVAPIFQDRHTNGFITK